jgi:hypothetical protein
VAVSLIVLAGCGSSTTTTTTTTPTVSNTAPVTVGPLVPSTPYLPYVNGVYTSVTVCLPGTTVCQIVPNILVDTGSVGLRVLYTALGSLAPEMSLLTQGGTHDVLQECVQFADFSYVWGPVALANIQIAGETALQVPGSSLNVGVPMQLILTTPEFPVPESGSTNCLHTPPGSRLAVDANTVETLGANGILGVGLFPQDCGNACTPASGNPPNQYFYCSTTTGCAVALVPLENQVWNPVAAFSSSDTNGVLLSLPAVTASGSQSVAGSLIFGIGTQSDNSLGSATIYAADEYGNFPSVVYNGVAYNSPANGSFIDSGTTAYYFSDHTTLGIPECLDQSGHATGYYCPPTTLEFTVTPHGANGTTGSVGFSITNASTLFASGNAAFSNLGGDSGTGVLTDYVDLGLPFFYGRKVFVGISGSTPPNNVSAPYGYWAF